MARGWSRDHRILHLLRNRRHLWLHRRRLATACRSRHWCAIRTTGATQLHRRQQLLLLAPVVLSFSRRSYQGLEGLGRSVRALQCLGQVKPATLACAPSLLTMPPSVAMDCGDRAVHWSEGLLAPDPGSLTIILSR